MELTLGAAGQVAMVIVHSSRSSDGDVPNELRWLVALMVEHPPAAASTHDAHARMRQQVCRKGLWV